MMVSGFFRYFRAHTGMLVGALVFLIGLVGVVRLFDVNLKWVDDVKVPSANSLDADLFDKLLADELIWIERDAQGMWIQRPRCNSFVLENPDTALPLNSAGKVFDEQEQSTVAKHVLELCGSDIGARIISNIDVFNGGTELIAIRDDRARAEFQNGEVKCHGGESVAALFIPEGCLRSAWMVRVKDGQQAIRTIASESIPIEDYYILAASLPRLMSDWAVAKPYRGAGKTADLEHEFVSNITFEGEPVTLDVVGEVVGVSVDGIAATGNALKSDRAGALPIKVGSISDIAFERVCKSKNDKIVACTADEIHWVSATRLTLHGVAGQEAEVIVTILPGSPNRRAASQASILGAGTSPKLGDLGLTIRRIAGNCPEMEWKGGSFPIKGPANKCKVSWLREVPNEDEQIVHRTDKIPFALEIEGIKILSSEGDLTTDGFALGYGDILGYGVNDLGSFADFLSTREGADEIELTIKPSMQRRLKAILDNRRSGGRTSERAELVLLDAEGDDAGAILGFASRPAGNVGLSDWDIRALGKAKPELSPFAAHAWIAHNELATPGSTFKLITALAGIQYVLDEGDAELGNILMGKATPELTAARLGWVRTTSSFQGACKPLAGKSHPSQMNAFPIYDRNGNGRIAHCIGNFGRVQAGNDMRKGTEGCRPGDSSEQTGLCEAITKSSNLFFAGLAMQIGKARLYGSGAAGLGREIDGEFVTDLPIDLMAKRLMGGRKMHGGDLALFDMLDPGFESGRAPASTIRFEATQKMPSSAIRTRGIEIALGGIGQSVSATPLAMAVTAASIATEKVVFPRIAQRDPAVPILDIPLITVPNGKEALYNEMLLHLRRGMNGVAQRGTGRGAVSGLSGTLKSSVFIKTGTADISDGMNAAWIVGYVMPPGGDSGITRTLAFACRVAPVRGGGGTICAPIIRDLLNDLNQNGL